MWCTSTVNLGPVVLALADEALLGRKGNLQQEGGEERRFNDIQL